MAWAYAINNYIEATGTAPTWDDILSHIQTPETVEHRRLWQPIVDSWTENFKTAPKLDRDLAWKAAMWRLGNMYLSTIRELWVLSVARHRLGLNVQTHPLADAVFRVDAWLDDIVLAVCVANSKFHDPAGNGRKTPASAMFRDDPTIRVVEIGLPNRHVFGRIWLPDISDVRGAFDAALPTSRPHAA